MSKFVDVPMGAQRTVNTNALVAVQCIMRMKGYCTENNQFQLKSFIEEELRPAYQSALQAMGYATFPAVAFTGKQFKGLLKVDNRVSIYSCAIFYALFTLLRDELNSDPTKGAMLSGILASFRAKATVLSYSDFCFPWLGKFRDILAAGDPKTTQLYPDLAEFVRRMEDLAARTDAEWEHILTTY